MQVSYLLILFYIPPFLPTKFVVRILYPVRSPQSSSYTLSVFYSQSIFSSPRFIPNPCLYPVHSPQSAVRSPQSMFYTDRFSAVLKVGPMAKHKDKIKVYQLSNSAPLAIQHESEKPLGFYILVVSAEDHRNNNTLYFNFYYIQIYGR